MKKFIGLDEKVEILGKKYNARIDTGARRSSIDRHLARRLGFKEIGRKVVVRSANGEVTRDLTRIRITLNGRTFNALFTLAERAHMSYRILIGRNILKRGFLIDTSKV